MTNLDAIGLLVARFPIILSRIDTREDLTTAAPYFAYSLLGGEVIARAADPQFMMDVCKFLNFLAESKEPILEEVLVVSVLERIADEPTVVNLLRPCLGESALSFLTQVEKEMFGRDASG
jgi:hypothetical protein